MVSSARPPAGLLSEVPLWLAGAETPVSHIVCVIHIVCYSPATPLEKGARSGSLFNQGSESFHQTSLEKNRGTSAFFLVLSAAGVATGEDARMNWTPFLSWIAEEHTDWLGNKEAIKAHDGTDCRKRH